MHIDDLFQSPKNRLAAFSEMQVHLYRRDVSLQDYFEALQLDSLTNPAAKVQSVSASRRIRTWALQGADKAARSRRDPKIKTDVLLCPNPDLSRKTEVRFLTRALLGLAETDAKILCLLPSDTPCREELDARLASAGRGGQVTFLDPTSPLNPVEARLRWRIARMRGRTALEKAIEILEPYGLAPSEEVRVGFERLAHYVEAWERLAPCVEFGAVVARCHWLALCSPVCRTARERGKPVVTFQQGVIGHTLDVPVTASKYVAFGKSSASFLAKLNGRFFEAVEMPTPPTEYVDGGSLFDSLTALPDQFDNQTLLLVDTQVNLGDFYGVENQCQALLQLAEKLLASSLPLRRVVIRPHPYWSTLDFEACQRLIRQFSARCELSHPAWTLEDDLRRSSAVVGILSGVLTVASACGLPTIFLETLGGYATGDLSCFRSGQTLLPEAAFYEIGKILTDRRAYAEARRQALQNAHEYYSDGSDLKLGTAFFERLLRADSGQPTAA